MEEAKGERKMLWYANPFFGRVRKGAKGDYKLRHVCLSA
jgi:hypothetical protein